MRNTRLAGLIGTLAANGALLRILSVRAVQWARCNLRRIWLQSQSKSFSGTIMNNGDFVNPGTGDILGNIMDYIP